jgi:hypothetical protein
MGDRLIGLCPSLEVEVGFILKLLVLIAYVISGVIFLEVLLRKESVAAS